MSIIIFKQKCIFFEHRNLIWNQYIFGDERKSRRKLHIMKKLAGKKTEVQYNYAQTGIPMNSQAAS